MCSPIVFACRIWHTCIDLLLTLGGIGCFVSSAITLLVRSHLTVFWLWLHSFCTLDIFSSLYHPRSRLQTKIISSGCKNGHDILSHAILLNVYRLFFPPKIPSPIITGRDTGNTAVTTYNVLSIPAAPGRCARDNTGLWIKWPDRAATSLCRIQLWLPWYDSGSAKFWIITWTPTTLKLCVIKGSSTIWAVYISWLAPLCMCLAFVSALVSATHAWVVSGYDFHVTNRYFTLPNVYHCNVYSLCGWPPTDLFDASGDSNRHRRDSVWI